MFAKFLMYIGIGSKSEEKSTQQDPSDLSFCSPPSYAESVRDIQLGQAGNEEKEKLLDLETVTKPLSGELSGFNSPGSSLVNLELGDDKSKLQLESS